MAIAKSRLLAWRGPLWCMYMYINIYVYIIVGHYYCYYIYIFICIWMKMTFHKVKLLWKYAKCMILYHIIIMLYMEYGYFARCPWSSSSYFLLYICISSSSLIHYGYHYYYTSTSCEKFRWECKRDKRLDGITESDGDVGGKWTANGRCLTRLIWYGFGNAGNTSPTGVYVSPTTNVQNRWSTKISISDVKKKRKKHTHAREWRPFTVTALLLSKQTNFLWNATLMASFVYCMLHFASIFSCLSI